MTGTVTGFGGVFFRARNPEQLKTWYATHLGVPSFDFWTQTSGDAVFNPFEADTGYWPRDKQWMLNFRVDGLDALISRLQAAGIAVETRPEEWDDPAIGRFARITDPEGNSVELWEPSA